MKNIKWVGLLATVLPLHLGFTQAPVIQSQLAAAPAQIQGGEAVPANISPAAAEVVRLSESGVGDDVVLAYVQNSQTRFDLSADAILYLKDLGIPSQVVSAMLNRDSAFQNQAQPPPTAQPPPVASVPEQRQPQQPEAPPVYVSNPPPEVNYFYNDLSPYGTWVQLDGIGWCWQPRAVVINRAWRPYCDSGHWVYSDCGWYWQSDYSWGWAPFHYGRWQLHDRCGWVWTPDRVWGPAWVTWRSAGEQCGWAPLPPHAIFEAGFGWRVNGIRVGLNFDFGLRPDHFTFVAMHDFTDRDLRRRSLPRTEVTQVFNRTTIINNYTVNNNTVINHGIPVDRVSSATHTQIHKAVLRDAPAGAQMAGSARVSERNGAASVVYRHQLNESARPANIVAQKVDERHPVVQHAPVVPARMNQGVTTGNGFSTRSSGYQRTQPQVSTRERSTTVPQTEPANPRAYQQVPRDGRQTPTDSRPATRSSGQTINESPQNRRVEQPITRSTPAATPSIQQQPRPVVSSPQSRPEPSARSYQPEVARDTRREPQTAANPHVYYPKSYPPPSESRTTVSRPAPSESRSISRPEPQPRQEAPPTSSGNGRGDNSQRNNKRGDQF